MVEQSTSPKKVSMTRTIKKDARPQRRQIEENFPAIVVLLIIVLAPLIGVAFLQGKVSALSLQLDKAQNTLQLEEEKLDQLTYQLKELQSLQRIEKAALSLGLVKNDKTEIVVLTPPEPRSLSDSEAKEAGPVEIKGAAVASLFNRLLDFLYGLLGG